MRATLKLEALIERLEELSVPHELCEQLVNIYRQTYKEAYHDGQTDARLGDDDDDNAD